ncbi:protein of unknown function (plasmid) [Caballeronia sp. S22]
MPYFRNWACSDVPSRFARRSSTGILFLSRRCHRDATVLAPQSPSRHRQFVDAWLGLNRLGRGWALRLQPPGSLTLAAASIRMATAFISELTLTTEAV